MSVTFDQRKDKELLYLTPLGDEVYFYDDSMVMRFVGNRGVVSTSNLNGGYREDLQFAFNNSCGRVPSVVAKSHCPLKGRNITEHYSAIAGELGLPITHTTGMGTAALIENAACASRSYHGIEVMAIATAGIDVNGGRAGDRAAHDEFTKSPITQVGTINVFLLINAWLDSGALTRALITATEAKTAALLELMANSMYSEDLATGSGTDSLIAVCNNDAHTVLYNTGKHVLMGEMIGRSVKEAVTKALALQTGMTPERQSSVEWQCKRYGLTRQSILHYYSHSFGDYEINQVTPLLDALITDNEVVASVACIAHLCDQNRWGLITDKTLMDKAGLLLNDLLRTYGQQAIDLHRKSKHTRYENQDIYKMIISDTILSLARILHSQV
ncbi:adenosylcobinamide amidohydrolase [Porphyromonas pogonae]|uniref:adenosylcobinamide amidohydrolase n=1 Tax=Porphyromonas pogonae TaxID=867595 RepID=UPI002E76DAB5|nr:adenosylcobinamide amidohydrolase [Porphyromonas pogonae]